MGGANKHSLYVMHAQFTKGTFRKHADNCTAVGGRAVGRDEPACQCTCCGGAGKRRWKQGLEIRGNGPAQQSNSDDRRSVFAGAYNT